VGDKVQAELLVQQEWVGAGLPHSARILSRSRSLAPYD
jgi:hypothetical protein